jgi:hypothetical protein
LPTIWPRIESVVHEIGRVGWGVDKPSSAEMTRDAVSSRHGDSPDMTRAIALLQEASVAECRAVYSGSNSVFLLSLAWSGHRAMAVYKPRRGESPLWDFPDGTLYRRERAAYLVSEALGWSIVPPTVIRSGPFGVGAVQWFVRAVSPGSYQTLVEGHQDEFKRIAAFDLLVNNADRKAGHCLIGGDGRVWGIDHGLTFHAEPKLRTVLWHFAGQPIPGVAVADLKAFRSKLDGRGPLRTSLSQLLAADEIEALARRLKTMIERPAFPVWSGSYRSVPWPPF